MLDAVFVVVIIIFSAVIHEVMHGLAADYLGDKTARYAGRLTLNPIPHIDPFGSILLPLLFVVPAALSGTSPGFLFAYAKPVPYNPYNLKPGRFSEAMVAFAGPASNFVIAFLMAMVIRLGVLPIEIEETLLLIVFINVMLFLLNLIPIPPLDGSKVLQALLPSSLEHRYANWRYQMEGNPFLGMGLVILVIILLGGQFGQAVATVARALAGL